MWWSGGLAPVAIYINPAQINLALQWHCASKLAIATGAMSEAVATSASECRISHLRSHFDHSVICIYSTLYTVSYRLS